MKRPRSRPRINLRFSRDQIRLPLQGPAYMHGQMRLINTKGLQRLLGKCRVTVYRRSTDPESHFPDGFRDGSNFTRWNLSEISRYQNSLRIGGSSYDLG